MLQFIEKSGVPAAWTLLGAASLPTDHPLNVGMLGMHGNYGPNIKTNEADLIIGLGMRFDDRVTGKVSTYATNAKIVHFDIDPAEINKNVQTDVAVIADIKETFEAIIPLLKENKHEAWLNQFKTAYQF